MTSTVAADYDPLTMSETDPDAEYEYEESAEEEEEMLFSVMRRGETEGVGPYSQEAILLMLNEGQLSAQGSLFYEGLEDWTPIEAVFEIQEQISHFVDDGQDRERVAECFREVSKVLAVGEDIYYIAVQERSNIMWPFIGSTSVTCSK